MMKDKVEVVDLEKTESDIPPFFKRKEAYILSVIIGVVALLLEWYMFSGASSSNTSRGKVIVAIPVVAGVLIKSIFKNTRK